MNGSLEQAQRRINNTYDWRKNVITINLLMLMDKSE